MQPGQVQVLRECPPIPGHCGGAEGQPVPAQAPSPRACIPSPPLRAQSRARCVLPLLAAQGPRQEPEAAQGTGLSSLGARAQSSQGLPEGGRRVSSGTQTYTPHRPRMHMYMHLTYIYNMIQHTCTYNTHYTHHTSTCHTDTYNTHYTYIHSTQVHIPHVCTDNTCMHIHHTHTTCVYNRHRKPTSHTHIEHTPHTHMHPTVLHPHAAPDSGRLSSALTVALGLHGRQLSLCGSPGHSHALAPWQLSPGASDPLLPLNQLPHLTGVQTASVRGADLLGQCSWQVTRYVKLTGLSWPQG